MARPKKDGSPTAEARIEAAFFDTLEVTPFDKITISAIVQAAKVHRNSFYYHYAGLDDLAHSAVSNLLIPEIPALLASGFTPESERIDGVFTQVATSTDRLRRVPVILGAHSTASLRNMLKAALLDLWLDTFELTRDELDARTAMTVDFALGGMFELFSKFDPRADVLAELLEVRRLPIVQTAVHLIMNTLAGALLPGEAAASMAVQSRSPNR